MPPDEELINAVLAGDRERYAELVERYSQRTHALAYSYVNDPQAAEDIAQEAFVSAYRALRSIASPRAFSAWLTQIARNLARASLRKKRFKTQSLEVTAEPASTDAAAQPADRQVREVLNEALNTLSPKLREVVTLFYMQEQSVQKVSQFLNITENAVKQRLHRARTLLREHLDDAVKEGLAGIRPSQRFANAVMLALPAPPGKLGLAGGLMVKPLLWLLAIPWLGVAIIMLATAKATEMAMIVDVAEPYRPAFRRRMRRVHYLTLAMIAFLFLLMMCVNKGPWWGVGVLIVIGLFSLFPGVRWSLVFPTWQSRLCLVSVPVAVTLLCLHLIYPYVDGFLFWAILLFLVGQLGVQSMIPAMSPMTDLKCPGHVPPVSACFLQRHAMRFSRWLNIPTPIITRVNVEEDCILLANSLPRVLFFLRRLANGLFEARLYPDGRVEVELLDASTLPPECVSPDECKERVRDWIRTKWAFYLAGNKKAARSLTLSFFSADFFKTPKGFRLQHYAKVVMPLLIVVFLVAWFHLHQPTMTDSDLRSFYTNEFLTHYENDFSDLPEDEPRMILYYKQPPSMMDIPGLAGAYVDLHEKERETSVKWILRYQASKLINGLEAGYLTISLLQSWGLTRESLLADQDKDWASLAPKTLSGEETLDSSELKSVASRVRLLNALGLLDLMDANVPDEIVKRLWYRDRVFRITEDQDYRDLETTCHVACILNLFDRWDVTDHMAVRGWMIDWLSENRRAKDAKDMYHLALGVISVGAEDDLPLHRIAERIRPKIGVNSEKSAWSIGLYDINAFAIKDILSTASLLELRYQISTRQP